MDGFQRVLLYSTVAALAAALGALPFAARDRVPEAWIGWANALAAGLMLGAAYVLMIEGLHLSTVGAAAGSALGISFVWWSHAVSRTADLDVHDDDAQSAQFAQRFIRRSTLHSAAEGVGIGSAMVVTPELGVFLALAFGVHNVPEGTALTAVLRPRGTSVAGAALACIAVNGSQILLAALAYVMAVLAPGWLPWILGFAAGALVYLVMVELLPESYHQAGHTSIAMLASAAIGAVVLLRHFVGGR